jgi:hypothetical protein
LAVATREDWITNRAVDSTKFLRTRKNRFTIAGNDASGETVLLQSERKRAPDQAYSDNGDLSNRHHFARL